MAVAHRMYARALYEAAEERGRLDTVREQLGDFLAALRQVDELRELLANPELDSRAKVSVLEAIAGDADELVLNFLRLAVEKGRGAELEQIIEELEAMAAAREGRLQVELTTAYELTDEEAQSIVKKIEDASGRPVEATRRVDPGLIGGLVLQAGSLRLDASVRGRLERLRHALVTARS